MESFMGKSLMNGGRSLGFCQSCNCRYYIGTSTDLDGQYEMSIAPGTYTIRATYLGYGDSEKEITIVDNERIEINFE